MAQSSIQLPPDGSGKKVPTSTFAWGAEPTVHAQGLFICDASGNVVGVTNNALQVQVANFPATQPVSGTVNVGNFPASQSVSNFPATQAVSAVALPLPSGASTETTLAGVKTGTDRIPAQVASRLPTGRATEVNRTNVTLGFDATIGTAAEALASISGVRGNAAVAGATTQTVTALKTLRIMSFRAVVMAGGTAVVNARVRIRANYTGAALVSSPVYAELRPGIITATAIANEVSPDETLIFPDGLDFPAGTSFGISHVMTGTVTGTQVSAQLVGFEYG